MYHIFSSLTVIFLITCVVSYLYVYKRRTFAIFASVTATAAGIGVVLLIFSTCSFNSLLNNGEYTEEFASWARDTYNFFIKFITIISGITVLLSVISSFLKPKHKYMRGIFISLSSILILISSNVYSYIAESDNINMKSYILMSGLAISLITIFPIYFDYLKLMNSQPKNKERRKK